MVALIWDAVGEKTYETGTDHGVLYPAAGAGYGTGVAWNGLTAVTESPSGAEATAIYADNIKYLNLISAEDFGGTIEAYDSPKEFDECDGSVSPVVGVSIGQQTRKGFGFSYRTLIGNDVEGNDFGYKIHLVYGAKASVSEKAYATVNDTPEPTTLSWEFSTTPVPVTGLKPTAIVVIDSTTTDPVKLAQFEEILYGNETTEPRLPLPDEVVTLLTPETPSPVTPAAPTFDAETDVITIPTTTGVNYQVDGSIVTGSVGPITEVTEVTAVATAGNTIAQGATTTWSFDPAA